MLSSPTTELLDLILQCVLSYWAVLEGKKLPFSKAELGDRGWGKSPGFTFSKPSCLPPVKRGE